MVLTRKAVSTMILTCVNDGSGIAAGGPCADVFVSKLPTGFFIFTFIDCEISRNQESCTIVDPKHFVNMCSVKSQIAEDAKRFSIDIWQLQELGQAAIKAKDRAYCK